MNNPLVRLAVVLVVLLGGGWFALKSWRGKTAEYEHRLELERIRKEFLLREPMARSLADPDKYKAEQRALWKWYFAELTDHYNKFASFKNYERFLDDLGERKRARRIKEPELAQYEERYQLTKRFWDLATGGRYDPPFTAWDKGLRFDVFKVETAPEAGEPRVRMHFALWGAQRKWNVDSAGGARVVRLNVSASFQDMVFKGLDAEDKLVREMRASGDPFKIDHPDRFIEELPPGVVIGYYDIPKIPSVVAKAELTFQVATRSVITGEDAVGTFVWKFPADGEWRLPVGIGWENAEEQVREQPGAAAVKR